MSTYCQIRKVCGILHDSFVVGVVLEEEIKHEDTMKKKIIKDWQEYQSDNKKHEKQFKYLQHDTNGVGFPN